MRGFSRMRVSIASLTSPSKCAVSSRHENFVAAAGSFAQLADTGGSGVGATGVGLVVGATVGCVGVLGLLSPPQTLRVRAASAAATLFKSRLSITRIRVLPLSDATTSEDASPDPRTSLVPGEARMDAPGGRVTVACDAETTCDDEGLAMMTSVRIRRCIGTAKGF
jgi:hypothetical protein